MRQMTDTRYFTSFPFVSSNRELPSLTLPYRLYPIQSWGYLSAHLHSALPIKLSIIPQGLIDLPVFLNTQFLFTSAATPTLLEIIELL